MKFIKLFVASVSIVVLLSQIVFAQGAVLGSGSDGKVSTVLTKDAFFDVSKEHSNYTAIQYIHEKGIIEGYADGRFFPDKTINRAEFTKILMGAALAYNSGQDPSGYDIYAPVGLNFSDVEDQAWYIPYLRKAVSNGVVQGYEDGTFRPANQISFAEASKIIVRSFGYDVPAETGIWYKSYVEELEEKAVIPVSIRKFDQQITRGETAEILYRLMADVTDKDSQTYDSMQKFLQSQETNIQVVTSALNSLDGMKSFDYVLFMEGKYILDGTASLQIVGSYGESDDGMPMLHADMKISSFESGSEKSVSLEFLIRNAALYFYLNRTVDDGMSGSWDEYYDQWWKLDLPPDAMDGLRQIPEDSVGQFGGFSDSFDLKRLFLTAEYMGTYEVLGEKSSHYRMQINKEVFQEFVQEMAWIHGNEMTEMDKAELERELFGSDVFVEISVNDNGVMTRLKVELKGEGDVFSFTVAFGSFNEPFDVEAPLNSELFPIEDLFPALMTME